MRAMGQHVPKREFDFWNESSKSPQSRYSPSSRVVREAALRPKSLVPIVAM